MRCRQNSRPLKLRANFLKSLVAVVSGNALYFLALTPWLPPAGRHGVSRIDLGLLIDFWLCLLIYGLIELLVRRKQSTVERK